MSSLPNQSTEYTREQLMADIRQLAIEELTTPGPNDQYSSTALMVANRARREWEAVALQWREKNRVLESEIKELKERVYELEKRTRLRTRAVQSVPRVL